MNARERVSLRLAPHIGPWTVTADVTGALLTEVPPYDLLRMLLDHDPDVCGLMRAMADSELSNRRRVEL